MEAEPAEPAPEGGLSSPRQDQVEAEVVALMSEHSDVPEPVTLAAPEELPAAASAEEAYMDEPHPAAATEIASPRLPAQDDGTVGDDRTARADVADPAALLPQASQAGIGSAAALDTSGAALMEDMFAQLGLEELPEGGTEPQQAEPQAAEEAAEDVEAAATPAADCEATDALVFPPVPAAEGSQGGAEEGADRDGAEVEVEEEELLAEPLPEAADMAELIIDAADPTAASPDAPAEAGLADAAATAADAEGAAAAELAAAPEEAGLPAGGSTVADEEPEAAAAAPFAAEQAGMDDSLAQPERDGAAAEVEAAEQQAALPALERGEGAAASSALESVASAALESLPTCIGPGDPPGGGAADAYSELFQREVSAKLLEVLSQEQLQEQEEALADDGSTSEPGGELPAVADLPPSLPLAAEADCASPAEPGASPDPPACLLKWAPPAAKHGRKGHGLLPAASTSPGGAAGQSGPKSPSHRMAPMGQRSPHSTHSPPAAPTARSPPAGRSPAIKMPPLNRTGPAASTSKSGGAGGSPGAVVPARRLSKPSMNEVLAAASSAKGSHGGKAKGAGVPKQLSMAPPPAQGQAPRQLLGAGAVPAAFPALATAPPESLLHWSRRAAVAAPAQGPPTGWFPAGPLAGPGFPGPPPGLALLPGLLPSGLMVPGQAGPPQGAASRDPTLPSEAAEPSAPAKPDGPDPAGEAAAEATADDAASAPPADELGLPGEGQRQQDAGREPGHPYSPAAGQPAAASAPQAIPGMPQEQAVDVASSWPPYEGAKLPPLYQDQVSATAGLIPAVHSAASFSVSPNRHAGMPRAWRQAPQQAPPGYYAMPAAGMPPGAAAAIAPQQWGGYVPAAGSLSEQQQQALYYQQQYQFFQQQYQQQYQAEYQALQQLLQQQQQDLHPDEPYFIREPIPQVPVALDPSGRPFKVFHGVAARSIRKPDRYQGDGRPAWSVK